MMNVFVILGHAVHLLGVRPLVGNLVLLVHELLQLELQLLDRFDIPVTYIRCFQMKKTNPVRCMGRIERACSRSDKNSCTCCSMYMAGDESITFRWCWSIDTPCIP